MSFNEMLRFPIYFNGFKLNFHLIDNIPVSFRRLIIKKNNHYTAPYLKQIYKHSKRTHTTNIVKQVHKTYARLCVKVVSYIFEYKSDL